MRNRKMSLNNIWEIKNYLTKGRVNPRQKMTDRQRLARKCNFSLSHVTNMLNGVRTATPKFVDGARKLAESNIASGRV